MFECFIEGDYGEKKELWAMQVKPAPYHTFSQMATPKISQVSKY